MRFLQTRTLPAGTIVQIEGLTITLTQPATAEAEIGIWSAIDGEAEDLPEPDKTVAQQAKSLLERNDL